VNNSCCSIQGSDLFSVATRNPECPHSTLVTSGQPEAILFLCVFVRVLELLSGIVNALINFALIADQHERKLIAPHLLAPFVLHSLAIFCTHSVIPLLLIDMLNSLPMQHLACGNLVSQ
jgi:hypothetical protein